MEDKVDMIDVPVQKSALKAFRTAVKCDLVLIRLIEKYGFAPIAAYEPIWDDPLVQEWVRLREVVSCQYDVETGDFEATQLSWLISNFSETFAIGKRYY